MQITCLTFLNQRFECDLSMAGLDYSLLFIAIIYIGIY